MKNDMFPDTERNEKIDARAFLEKKLQIQDHSDDWQGHLASWLCLSCASGSDRPISIVE